MQSLKDKYALIDEFRSTCSVCSLCCALNVSRSSYYQSKHRKMGKREKNNQVLLRAIIETHQKYPAFGLDSMYHYLKPKFGASRARIHRLMVKFNIHSIRTRAYKITTNSEHSKPIAPNLVNRNFNPPLPNMIWVGDITYIKTAQGWLYLAIVKDLCTKKIVGYSFSNRIDSKLVCEALIMAVNRQNPPHNLIFHSDRGSQYSSFDFRKLLTINHINQSMSRKGNPYDNAVAENFFSCLKCEFTFFQNFRTRHEAQVAIFRYIEGYYNFVRPHSSLGWLSPNNFELSFKIS